MMSTLKLTRVWMGSRLFLALLFVLASPSAWAVNVPIKAKFTPDPNNTRVNEFVNLTPISGYCTEPRAGCKALKIFSIEAKLSFVPETVPQNADVYIKAPGDWRKVKVTHPTAGSQEVEIRIGGVGSTYRLGSSAKTISGTNSGSLQVQHSLLWGAANGRDWVFVPSGCAYTGKSYVSAVTYNFFWKVLDSSRCSKKSSYELPGFTFDNIDFSYELRTPNPLAMHSGTYTGSLIFEVGPNKDFDFNGMTPVDNVVSFDFSLEVVHSLKIEIPPGGDRVELVPEGGWQRWLNGGKAPSRLFRDQTFLISSSTPFKMYIECGSRSGDYCNLDDPTGTSSVPVQVSVTLPGGFSDHSGASIQRRALNHIQGMSAASAGSALQVKPAYYVDRSPAMLHFEVPKQGVDEVLKKDGSSRYNGKITVIWDSDI